MHKEANYKSSRAVAVHSSSLSATYRIFTGLDQPLATAMPGASTPTWQRPHAMPGSNRDPLAQLANTFGGYDIATLEAVERRNKEENKEREDKANQAAALIHEKNAQKKKAEAAAILKQKKEDAKKKKQLVKADVWGHADIEVGSKFTMHSLAPTSATSKTSGGTMHQQNKVHMKPPEAVTWVDNPENNLQNLNNSLQKSVKGVPDIRLEAVQNRDYSQPMFEGVLYIGSNARPFFRCLQSGRTVTEIHSQVPKLCAKEAEERVAEEAVRWLQEHGPKADPAKSKEKVKLSEYAAPKQGATLADFIVVKPGKVGKKKKQPDSAKNLEKTTATMQEKDRKTALKDYAPSEEPPANRTDRETAASPASATSTSLVLTSFETGDLSAADTSAACPRGVRESPIDDSGNWSGRAGAEPEDWPAVEEERDEPGYALPFLVYDTPTWAKGSSQPPQSSGSGGSSGSTPVNYVSELNLKLQQMLRTSNSGITYEGPWYDEVADVVKCDITIGNPKTRLLFNSQDAIFLTEQEWLTWPEEVSQTEIFKMAKQKVAKKAFNMLTSDADMGMSQYLDTVKRKDVMLRSGSGCEGAAGKKGAAASYGGNGKGKLQGDVGKKGGGKGVL